MKSDIRCLAVRQPWAWALMTGVKNIENRTWKTDYRGPIVIQASASKTEVNQLGKAGKLPPRDFVYGALLGIVDLVDVVPMSEDLEANPWAWGPYCWKVANPRIFPEPIPAKGKLTLYAIQEELAERVRPATLAARPQEHDDLGRRWLSELASPDSVEGRAEGLFDSYIELWDGANASRIADGVLARSRTADALIDRARARIIANETDGALADLSDALNMEPENARAYFVRGFAYEVLAQASKARAAELDPNFAEEDAPDETEEANDEGEA